MKELYFEVAFISFVYVLFQRVFNLDNENYVASSLLRFIIHYIIKFIDRYFKNTK